MPAKSIGQKAKAKGGTPPSTAILLSTKRSGPMIPPAIISASATAPARVSRRMGSRSFAFKLDVPQQSPALFGAAPQPIRSQRRRQRGLDAPPPVTLSSADQKK